VRCLLGGGDSRHWSNRASRVGSPARRPSWLTGSRLKALSTALLTVAVLISGVRVS
jgi:hypothetical protein